MAWKKTRSHPLSTVCHFRQLYRLDWHGQDWPAVDHGRIFGGGRIGPPRKRYCRRHREEQLYFQLGQLWRLIFLSSLDSLSAISRTSLIFCPRNILSSHAAQQRWDIFFRYSDFFATLKLERARIEPRSYCLAIALTDRPWLLWHEP